MRLVSNKAILTATGLPAPTFNTWLKDGVVSGAVCGGEGRGNHRKWTVTQAVGIVVAVAIRDSEQSCVLSFVSKVAEAFGAIDEGELTKLFAKGMTHFVTVHQGKPWLAPKEYDWVSVKAAYDAVVKAANL